MVCGLVGAIGRLCLFSVNVRDMLWYVSQLLVYIMLVRFNSHIYFWIVHLSTSFPPNIFFHILSILLYMDFEYFAQVNLKCWWEFFNSFVTYPLFKTQNNILFVITNLEGRQMLLINLNLPIHLEGSLFYLII